MTDSTSLGDRMKQYEHAYRYAFAKSVATLDPAVRAAMFLKLDGKDLALHLWRNVKPETTTPFRDDEEG